MRRFIVYFVFSFFCLSVSYASERSHLEQIRDQLNVSDWVSYVGTTERSSIFLWRDHFFVQGGVGSQVELNAFETFRENISMRYPFPSWVLQAGLSRVKVTSTPVSDQLSQTTLRQYGQPNRYELEIGAEWPVAEGVGHTLLSFGASQFVFSLEGKVKGLFYPVNHHYSLESIYKTPFDKLSLPPGMAVDANHVNVSVGGRVDHYFPLGFYVSTYVLYVKSSSVKMIPWWEGGVGFGVSVL